jgi:hypothetical protein
MKSGALASGRAIVVRMVGASLIFIGSACGNGPTDSDPGLVIRISGTVYSGATQTPVKGAQVILSFSSFLGDRGAVQTTTEAAGTYSLERSLSSWEAKDHCSGSISLGASATAAGFQPGHQWVRCIAGVNQPIHFVLWPQ